MHTPTVIIAALAVMLLMLYVTLIPGQAQVARLVESQLPNGLCTTFRWQYGAESAQEAAALLDYPCHHNWIVSSYGVPNHTPFAYSMSPSYLAGYVADAEADEFWLIGNEPNLGATFTKPSEAALFASGWVTQTDVAWACCGTLQHYDHSYLLNWLDSYLAAGGPVPDAWHIHIYFVDDGAGWDATLAQFRDWMTANDVVRPVIVSETAQTHGGDAEPLLLRVARAVCDGDVQAVYWYIGDKDFHNFAPSSQLTVDGVITELGKVFVGSQTCLPVEPTDDEPIAQPSQPWRLWLPTAGR